MGYCQRVFQVEFGNGQMWLLLADEEAEPWLAKFSSILGLGDHKTGVDAPKLIFARQDMADEAGNLRLRSPLSVGMFPTLPTKGWRSYSLKAVRLSTHPETGDTLCNIGREKTRNIDFIRMWEVLYPLYRRAINAGGIPLHAALAQREGQAALLVGEGGMGKSTCSRRLAYPWQAVCDDEVMVVLDRENGYLVHPFPTWSDYICKRPERTWRIEESFPLSGIFFLDKSESDEIVPLSQAQSAMGLNRSSQEACFKNHSRKHTDTEAMLKRGIFMNSCQLAAGVPAFKLRVSLTGKFWEKMEEALCSIKA